MLYNEVETKQCVCVPGVCPDGNDRAYDGLATLAAQIVGLPSGTTPCVLQSLKLP